MIVIPPDKKSWKTCYWGLSNLTVLSFFVPPQLLGIQSKPSELEMLLKKRDIPTKYYCANPKIVAAIFEFYKTKASKSEHFRLAWPNGNLLTTDMHFDDKMNQNHYARIFDLLSTEGRDQLKLIRNDIGLNEALSNNAVFEELNVAKRIDAIVAQYTRDCLFCNNFLSREAVYRPLAKLSK